MRDPGLRSHYKTELQVGVMMILAFIGLVVGIFWISGASFGGDDLTIYVKTDDAASVAEGATVTLRGVPIGSVEKVELVSDGVVVRLKAAPGGPLPSDTRASIGTAGFLGQIAVALKPGIATTPLASGDTIPAISVPGITALADELGSQATEVLDRTQRLMSDSVIASVQSGAGSFAGTMNELDGLLRRQSASLERMIQNLSAVSTSLEGATGGPELERTVSNLDSLTARLAAAGSEFEESSASLKSIMRKIDDGEGSMGRMINDPVLHDQTTAAMENLQAASEEMALLMKSFREDPKKYTEGLKISLF
ncbi:MAG: MlaD family protein [Gemmatimonadota bacterium]|jgi:phospholipid/cholesterol/gamma-HCH transport system substrate-binding protein